MFEQLNGIVNVVLLVVSIVTSFGSGIFFLKYIGTKTNIDGLKQNNTFLRDERDDYKEKAEREESERIKCEQQHVEDKRHYDSEMEAVMRENSTLREVANQTPQVLKLTESITKLTDINVKQHTENMGMLSRVVDALVANGKNTSTTSKEADHE